MKKFISFSLIFFCVLLMSNINALNDATATKELTLIFNGAKPIDIVLLTRNTPQSQYNPIELDEIALISACLAVNLRPESAKSIRNQLEITLKDFISHKYKPDLPNISKYLDISKYPINVNLSVFFELRQQKIIKKFDEYLQFLFYNKKFRIQIDNEEKWKIIIFNETFFSKNIPLTKQEVETIKNILFSFLKPDERIVLYTNFLYTNNEKITKDLRDSLVLRTLTPTYTNTQKMLLTNDNNNKSNVLDYLQLLMAIKDFSTPFPMLYNRSSVSYNGLDINYYDKSSYWGQSNDALVGSNIFQNKRHIYYIGDEQDHSFFEKNYPELSKLLIKNISSEICYDLTCGIRKNNNWDNGAGTTKLHIFISNTFITDSNTRKMFPSNIITVCADPYGTMLTNTDSSLTVVFKDDGNTKIPYPQEVTGRFNHENTQYDIITGRDIIIN